MEQASAKSAINSSSKVPYEMCVIPPKEDPLKHLSKEERKKLIKMEAKWEGREYIEGEEDIPDMEELTSNGNNPYLAGKTFKKKDGEYFLAIITTKSGESPLKWDVTQHHNLEEVQKKVLSQDKTNFRVLSWYNLYAPKPFFG